jgi:hypothetical protein
LLIEGVQALEVDVDRRHLRLHADGDAHGIDA